MTTLKQAISQYKAERDEAQSVRSYVIRHYDIFMYCTPNSSGKI